MPEDDTAPNENYLNPKIAADCFADEKVAALAVAAAQRRFETNRPFDHPASIRTRKRRPE